MEVQNHKVDGWKKIEETYRRYKWMKSKERSFETYFDELREAHAKRAKMNG